MKVEIKVPSMGESVTEATIGAILKESGSQVAMDEEILELETDKVNQVIYAPQAGVIQWSVHVDDTVTVGDVIGFVDGAASPGGAPTPAAAAPVPESVAVPTPAVPASPSGGNARVSKEAFAHSVGVAPTATVPATPTPAPAAAAVTAAPASKPAPAPVSNGGRPESRKRMTKIRQVIAQRLVEAQQMTAMLTTFNEVDMTSVMDVRNRYKEEFFKKHGTKLGFMSFFVKACVSALKAVPAINAYIDGNEIVQREYYDISIAVGTDRGLVVPVLRECDRKSYARIEQDIVDYATKAREGKIGVDDLQGGGFTITNGGVYGSLVSTPILNYPQSGILGMHKIQKRPVCIGDEVVVRPMMYLALSYDHRIVDGKEAVTFLVHVKEALEEPSRLLLEV